MNLKEAFRFQNNLTRLFDEGVHTLSNLSNVISIKETHLRKKAMPEAEDEVVEVPSDCEYNEHITEFSEFMLWLLGEKEKLSEAVRLAKKDAAVDIDGESGLNSQRRCLAQAFREMVNIRSGEVIQRSGGVGYKFNAEGNQVSYRYDVKRVTSINFDRNLIKKRMDALNAKVDEISADIDRAVINTEVLYTPPFDVNATLPEVFESFLEDKAQA